MIEIRLRSVTYPPKPWGNIAIYGDAPTHIDLASSR
jgi:hypothetical protein